MLFMLHEVYIKCIQNTQYNTTLSNLPFIKLLLHWNRHQVICSSALQDPQQGIRFPDAVIELCFGQFHSEGMLMQIQVNARHDLSALSLKSLDLSAPAVRKLGVPFRFCCSRASRFLFRLTS